LSKPAYPGSGNSAPGCKGLSRILARTFLAALVVVLLSTALSPVEAQDAVDATLVLAVDVSGSIDSREFVLQRQGYAKALTDKRFLNAVKGGEHGAIAVGYFEWTGPSMNAPVYECTVIKTAADAQKLADQLVAVPRLLYGGGTGVGEAIYAGIAMHERCAYPTDRRVIDVSGDGRTNRGRRAGPARDEAVKAGITVNGLAIINEEPDLEDYYRAEVMGGQGAFVAVVNDFESFEDAVIAKLVREISRRAEPVETEHADAAQ
jgi:hypothetical protein